MFQGNDLTKYSERQMQQVRGREISMIFQDPMTSLNPTMKVGKQIEAFLSFIGIGLAEPQASLGVLINGGYQVLRMYPHVLIFPAIVIVLIMVCFSILGDGLRDALDPQMRK